MRGTTWGLCLAATLALAGCDDAGNPLLVTNTPGGQLSITVTGGVAPTYAWEGARARLLTVSGGGEVVWQIEGVDAVGFDAPVRHGLTPAGARVLSAPQLLEVGTVYTISITNVNGVQGTRSFTATATTTP